MINITQTFYNETENVDSQNATSLIRVKKEEKKNHLAANQPTLSSQNAKVLL